MLKKFYRLKKLSCYFQKELSNIFYYDLRDPRLFQKFTITHVKVSHDLSYSKVFIIFWSLKTKDKIVRYLKILQNAAHFIGILLGKRISLRIFPKLFFLNDSSFLEGSRISLILKKKK
ncbi:30S ribosome-binding factor RbfA [Buchnera aphidicola]|uniref:30S ribosome-binding factor RbfA n=1 Tax=Buchnera aphidicola TaxID=9 RepID=UPI0031B6EE7E